MRNQYASKQKQKQAHLITFVEVLDHICNVIPGCIPYIQSVIPVGVVGQESWVIQTYKNICQNTFATLVAKLLERLECALQVGKRRLSV